MSDSQMAVTPGPKWKRIIGETDTSHSYMYLLAFHILLGSSLLVNTFFNQ